MSSLIDAVLIIGIVALLTGLLLGVFSETSKVRGTTAWKWRTILLIIGGAGLLMTIGVVSLWEYYHESQASDLIYGLFGIYFGFLMVWTNVRELRQVNRSSKMKAISGIISGMIFSIAYGLLAIFQFQEDGSFSFQNLLFVGIGIWLLTISMRKAMQLKTAPGESEMLA